MLWLRMVELLQMGIYMAPRSLSKMQAVKALKQKEILENTERETLKL